MMPWPRLRGEEGHRRGAYEEVSLDWIHFFFILGEYEERTAVFAQDRRMAFMLYGWVNGETVAWTRMNTRTLK